MAAGAAGRMWRARAASHTPSRCSSAGNSSTLGRRLWHAAVLMAVLFILIETGLVRLPMPHPARHDHFHHWPQEALWSTQPPEMPPFSLPLQQLAVRLFDGQLANVETVAVDTRSGRLLLPDKLGRVYEAWPDGSGCRLVPQPLVQMGPGRVLGAKLDADGHLVMCDVLRGLLRFNTSSGQVEVLASRVAHNGSPIHYANGLDIADNGSIYFTSSTDILPARARDGAYDTGFAWALNNLRGGRASGRVLVWHPHTRQVHVVASQLRYPDGIVLADDGSYLLVVETDARRVVKLWLAGDKAGQRDAVIAALPGLPAGLSKASDGNFWCSLTAPVPPYTKWLQPILVRALVAWMPRSWRPPVRVWGAVLKVSGQGKVLQVLLDPTGARVAASSAATEAHGRLFLGSLMGGHYISYVQLHELQEAEKAMRGTSAEAAAG